MMNKKKAYFKLFILIAIIVIIPIILYLTCQDTLFNTEWLKSLPDYLSNNKFIAAWSLIALQALQVIICILPGQPIQFAASYIFGVIGGYLISLAGAVIGAFSAFYLAKFLGTDAIKVIFGENKVEYYRNKINSGKGLLIAFFIYLIPGFPKDLVGYVAGISNMQVIPFIIISSIGRSPGMFGSLLFGTFFKSKDYKAIAILVLLCAVFLLICFIKKNDLIRILDELEEKDREREAKHNVKKTANKQD